MYYKRMKKNNLLIVIILFSLFFFGCIDNIDRETLTPEPESNNDSIEIYFKDQYIYNESDINISGVKIEKFKFSDTMITYHAVLPIKNPKKINCNENNDQTILITSNNKTIYQTELSTTSYNAICDAGELRAIVIGCSYEKAFEIYSAVKYIQNKTETKEEKNETNQTAVDFPEYELITAKKIFNISHGQELNLAVVTPQTFYLRLENETVGISVYQTSPGYTLSDRWAEIVVFTNETIVKQDGHFRNKNVNLVWEDGQKSGELAGLGKIVFPNSTINTNTTNTRINIIPQIIESWGLEEEAGKEYRPLTIYSQENRVEFDPPLPVKETNITCPPQTIDKIEPITFFIEGKKYILTDMNYIEKEISVANHEKWIGLSIGDGSTEVYNKIWITLVDVGVGQEIQIGNCTSSWAHPAILKIEYE